MPEPLDDLSVIRATLAVQRRGYLALVAERINSTTDLHRLGTLENMLAGARTCQESIDMIDRIIADETRIKDELAPAAAAE